MFKDYVETGLNSFAKAMELIQSGRATSIATYIRKCRIEPEVMLETSLANLPEVTDLLQVLCGTYSAYYMMGMSISYNIGRIETAKLLDKMATHRDPLDSIAYRVDSALSNESFEGLPMGLSFESARNKTVSMKGGRDNYKAITERPSLAVGRVLNIELEDQGSTGELTVMVRLNVNTIATTPLIQILTSDTRDLSASERFHDWASGRISFWKDAIGMRDLVSAHKKALMEDDTGTYDRIIKKKRQNQLAGLVSLNPSVNNMSAMVVISAETAAAVFREINGKLSRASDRQRVLNAMGAIFLVVVDTEWERVTIYTEGDDCTTKYAMSQLKGEVRSQGPDVQDLMKQFQRSTSPF